jgi:hypothetical protein
MISKRPVLRTAVLSVERGIRFHISNILLPRYAYRKLSFTVTSLCLVNDMFCWAHKGDLEWRGRGVDQALVLSVLSLKSSQEPPGVSLSNTTNRRVRYIATVVYRTARCIE